MSSLLPKYYFGLVLTVNFMTNGSPATLLNLLGIGGKGEARFIASKAGLLSLSSVASITSAFTSFPSISKTTRTVTVLLPATPGGYFHVDWIFLSTNLRH